MAAVPAFEEFEGDFLAIGGGHELVLGSEFKVQRLKQMIDDDGSMINGGRPECACPESDAAERMRKK
jgi:hypothetical protein